MLLDPNTIISRIQRRLPNASLSSLFDHEPSVTSRIISSLFLLRLTSNNVTTFRFNDLFVGVAKINAQLLPREENDARWQRQGVRVVEIITIKSITVVDENTEIMVIIVETESKGGV